ncbi:MAG: DUF3820 family protein [Saprospiraceae bacterium]
MKILIINRRMFDALLVDKLTVLEEFDWKSEVDKDILIEICRMRMPFGKYQGVIISDLPEAYLLWFKAKGFPKGRIGQLLENALEIKTNGMDILLKELKKRLASNQNR